MRLRALRDFMLAPRHPWKAFRLWRWRRKVNRSIRILDELDWYLTRIGWTRTQRRQFWRDFTKKQQNRTKVLNQITQ